ncbi:MAG: hypothetical protein KIT43_16650 [Bauldia sp.]|nr:hypothetical protein [Bauldia sp.]
MTKDGRPSRINDLRYFFGPEEHSGYLTGCEEAVAYGRRMAMFLNGEGFSMGPYPALYLLLNPSMDPGEVVVTDYGGDWWQRYTHVAVPADLPGLSNATEIVMDATVAALRAIRPDLDVVVKAADRVVREHGKSLRFLMRTQTTKRYLIEKSFSIGVWERVLRPQLAQHPSYIFTSLTDLSTGEFLDGPAQPHPFDHYSAFMFNKPVRVSEIEARLSSFVSRERPPTSKLVKPRG